MTTYGGAVTYLPPGKIHSSSDLEARMQSVIETEMFHTYNGAEYISAMKEDLCRFKFGDNDGMYIPLYRCQIDIVTPPRLQIIPTMKLSDDIVCTTTSCTIGYHDTTSVSTTHSEVGFTVEAGAKPFGVGMTFTASASYGFSNTIEELTTLSYEFNLEKDEAGYIELVNVQVSAKVHRRGCACLYMAHPQLGESMCDDGTFRTIDEKAHHESVIMHNGKPRGMVSFISQSF